MSRVSFGAEARGEFLLEPGIAFLNNGGFGATPRPVLAAAETWRRRMEAEPVRFVHEDLPTALKHARGEMAGFVGARLQDLVLVENATTGSNAVLRSLSFAPGDEILATDHGYAALRKLLTHVTAQTSARLVEAELPFPFEAPEAIVEAVTASITGRTRLVVLDLITSPTATRLPVEPIAQAARAAGARILIDAAHGPGQVDLDIPALGADWVTANAHKWLFACRGSGLLWAASDAQADLHPTVISHGYGAGFEEEFAWTGTRDPSNWLALPDAIAFYRQAGDRALRERNHTLAGEAATLLQVELGAILAAPQSMRGAMASLALPFRGPVGERTADALHDLLFQRYRIQVPIFAFANRLWVRISAQIFNEMADYERLAEALKRELG